MIQNIKEKVYKNSLETCEYVSGYENSKSEIVVRCKVHNHTFSTKYENIRRDNRAHHICPLCQKEDKENKKKEVRIEVQCAYCGISFTKLKSKADSKTGLHFCCREHKDMAQRISSGEKFKELRPDHYGDILSDYRKAAFDTFEHKCDCCGWNEDYRILEVHHIDSNHNNNDISNLVILCPICHRKITLGYYKYDKENHCLI